MNAFGASSESAPVEAPTISSFCIASLIVVRPDVCQATQTCTSLLRLPIQRSLVES